MRYLLMGQLSGIGGWQLYVKARAAYLRSEGYDVLLLSIFPEKDIKIKVFNEFKRIFVPETHIPPASFSQKQRKKILDNIFSFIGKNGVVNGDEFFIEATDMNLSMWGELIAKHYNAKCFNFLLHSHFKQPTVDVQKFFYFKYLREELAGMQASTLPTLFRLSDYEEEIESRYLRAVSDNQITKENVLPQEYEFIESKKKEGFFVVAYFGALEKPHFYELCDFIRIFAYNHENRKFLFVSVGSSSRKKSEKFQKNLEKKCDNCLTMNIPSLFPVPQNLFGLFDLCIASHGCATVAWRCGVLTIRLMDDVTLIPHGIMGIHVFDLTEKRVSESLDELVLGVYEGKYNLDMMSSYKLDYESFRKESLREIDDSVFKFNQKREYYNVDLIKNVGSRAKTEKILNYVFGVKITLFIIGFSRIVFRRLYNLFKKKETEAK